MDDDRSNPNYLRAVRERWRTIAVVAAIAIAAAVAYSLVAQKRYEATSDLLVSPVSSDTLVGLPLLRESLFGRSVVTVSRLAQSPEVVARVRQRLKLTETPAAVRKMISVTPQEQSDIVSITASADTPEEAARIANAFAAALLAERSERFQNQLKIVTGELRARLRVLSSRAGDPEAAAVASRLADFGALAGDKDPTLEIVSAASPPLTPAWPRPALGVVLAAIIGVLLGTALVIALEIARPVIRRVESLVERDAPPVLTTMPQLTASEARTLLKDPGDVPTEMRASVRTLWANLGRLPTDQKQAGMLLVTSAGDRGDSAAPAALLATLMARAGMRIMLIDADLERGPLSAIFDGDVASVSSLGTILEREDGSAGPTSVRSVVPSRLHVLLDDPEDRHLTKWMPPDRLSALVLRMKQEVDAVIVSAPPPPIAETTVLAELADAVAITVALGRTRRDEVMRLREILAERGVVPAGYIVLERRSMLKRSRRTAQASAAPQWT